MEELKRIPSISKLAPAVDIMDLTEVEEKVYQLCTLWELYVNASYELARKSKRPRAEAAKACKIYGLYISDILQQVDAVITIFAMENELRNLKGRGHFPIPKITPQGIRVDSQHLAKKTIDAVDRELTEILTNIRESEAKYEKEKDEAKLREQQARANKTVQRHDYNHLSPNSSTPIKNTDTGTGNQNRQTEGVHFNPYTVQHYYSMTGTTSHMGCYKLLANDSIIQAASPAPTGQLTTNPTMGTGRNESWRNNGINTQIHSNFLPHMTRMFGHNGLFNDSPNSSGNRNTPTCFRCGKQGHIRHKCRNRVYCAHCRSNNHSEKECRKLTYNTPSPSNSHIPTGHHPTATLPLLIGNTAHQGSQATTWTIGTTNNGLWFQNYQDTNQPRTSTTIQTPAANNMSPASTASVADVMTQLMHVLTHVVDNKKEETSKQMMKNITTFDGTNKTECINWLSQIEATAKYCNKLFRELVCQGMAPSMLHVLVDLSELSTDKEIKDVILVKYSDIPRTAEAPAKLQKLQI